MKEKHRYHVWDYVNIVVFYSIFILFLVASIMGIVQLSKGQIEAKDLIYRVSLTLLMCVPFLVKKIFRITFSRVVSIVYYLYMFLAGFLGVVLSFYVKVEWWDILIHFLMGLAVSVLSIYVLNLTVYKKDTSKHNLFFTFLFMLSFTMLVGVLWEILEFTGDAIFNMGYQRYVTYDGEVLIGRAVLIDTMTDLLMELLGATIGIVFTVITKKIDKNFLKSFKIKKLKHLEPEIEDIEE